MPGTTERDVDVDGVRVHLLEAGDPAAADGAAVLLLHGGAWGEDAAGSWSAVLDPLAAAGHRVLAPDWLGFGGSDKLRDFVDLPGRMVSVVARLLRQLGVGAVDAVGLSMGGAFLLRDVTSPAPVLPVRRLVLVSAGGPPIAGAARAALSDYDGTVESMRRQVELAFADPRWAADEEFVRRRHASSLLPGAYEFFASLALRAPGAGPPPPGDPTPYERIVVPALVTAGGRDRLKAPGYAEEVAARIPGARLAVLPEAGHCPQLESPEAWTAAVLDFLTQPVPDRAAAGRPAAGRPTADRPNADRPTSERTVA